jgi:hypothetical protein
MRRCPYFGGIECTHVNARDVNWQSIGALLGECICYDLDHKIPYVRKFSRLVNFVGFVVQQDPRKYSSVNLQYTVEPG